MLAKKECLFDCLERSYLGYSRFDESQFTFLNHSARENSEDVRQILERWFAMLPNEKKGRLRGHFRSNDQQHHGALLEMVTHEILCAMGAVVEVDPDLNGRTPDFAATYNGERILVECTVSQSSDDKVKAFDKWGCILQAIDSIETGNLCFDVTLFSLGKIDTPLDLGSLTSALEVWLDNLKRELSNGLRSTDPNQPVLSLEQEEYSWRHEGWEIKLTPGPGRPDDLIGTGSRAIRCKSWFGLLGGRFQLLKSIEKKARKYDGINLPYLIVAGAGMYFPEAAALEYALSGGFFERNRHVSAILYKDFDPHKSVWGLCHPTMPWELVHNPWATHPLQHEMFEFAKEWIHRESSFVEPKRTLNEVLGLPDPWPQSVE